ncbi:sensor histidine kinase [Heliophilum fasciatum]|uniref:histidine kinase n=1 Tax=Heliophilum fasciatum TaxID=35700 RepID=A0A4R2RWY7_9FIRM|nr:sensor histidine kinase [Heliophilum fasciatum]MCW2276637.1 two-component system sensor histidine kinase LytS [Heliophilum fasciatum]TCP68980.1 two-component system sensor histidine kinase LytS [Heliophilum fasciatum]
MKHDLFLYLAQRLTIVVTIAFLLSRHPAIRRFFAYQATTKRDILRISGIFGAISIIGTYAAVPIDGALANSRVIGPVLAGLLGGPWAGLGAGLIGGIHRWSLGGFTALACGISTVIEGLLGGLVRRYHPQPLTGFAALITGLMAETLQMLIILAVARPFEDAVELISHIALPMILVNASGIAIFVLMIQDLRAREEQASAGEAQKALQIATITAPMLRQGLNAKSARKVAQVVKNQTDLAAVALTSADQILAHVGLGEDHHLPGMPVRTEITREVLRNGVPVIATTKEEVQCSAPDCPLHSAIVVPLFSGNQTVGALKLYRARTLSVSLVDQELAKGLAHLFSTQLEIADLEKTARLKTVAEIRALQAQISPHFLFNALNTIASYVRTQPETARNLLIQLGDFFRKNLRDPVQFVTLADELQHIEAYLALEQARFEDRLQVVKDIDPQTLTCQVPPLLLQPLVENAIRHGLLPLRQGGTLTLRTCHVDDGTTITIADNGVGIPQTHIDLLLHKEKPPLTAITTGGIGVRNVHERLVTIYGPAYGLCIESSPGSGTCCTVRIPNQAPIPLTL